MVQKMRIASKEDFQTKNMMTVEIGGKTIALFKVGDSYHAIGNTCSHRGGPLSEGTLEGTTVTCPWHGAKFDVTNGKAIGLPARVDVPLYKVVVEGTDIMIELS